MPARKPMTLFQRLFPNFAGVPGELADFFETPVGVKSGSRVTIDHPTMRGEFRVYGINQYNRTVKVRGAVTATDTFFDIQIETQPLNPDTEDTQRALVRLNPPSYLDEPTHPPTIFVRDRNGDDNIDLVSAVTRGNEKIVWRETWCKAPDELGTYDCVLLDSTDDNRDGKLELAESQQASVRCWEFFPQTGDTDRRLWLVDRREFDDSFQVWQGSILAEDQITWHVDADA